MVNRVGSGGIAHGRTGGGRRGAGVGDRGPKKRRIRSKDSVAQQVLKEYMRLCKEARPSILPNPFVMDGLSSAVALDVHLDEMAQDEKMLLCRFLHTKLVFDQLKGIRLSRGALNRRSRARVASSSNQCADSRQEKHVMRLLIRSMMRVLAEGPSVRFVVFDGLNLSADATRLLGEAISRSTALRSVEVKNCSFDSRPAQRERTARDPSQQAGPHRARTTTGRRGSGHQGSSVKPAEAPPCKTAAYKTAERTTSATAPARPLTRAGVGRTGMTRAQENFREFCHKLYVPKITALSFKNCGLTHVDAHALSALLKFHSEKRNEIVWLSNLREHDQVTQHLQQQALGESTGSHGSITVHTSDLDEDEPQAALLAHTVRQGLVVLDLEDNNIGDEGFAVLAPCLQAEEWLVAINLRSNNLSNSSLRRLRRVLRQNPALADVVVGGDDQLDLALIKHLALELRKRDLPAVLCQEPEVSQMWGAWEQRGPLFVRAPLHGGVLENVMVHPEDVDEGEISDKEDTDDMPEESGSQVVLRAVGPSTQGGSGESELDTQYGAAKLAEILMAPSRIAAADEQTERRVGDGSPARGPHVTSPKRTRRSKTSPRRHRRSRTSASVDTNQSKVDRLAVDGSMLTDEHAYGLDRFQRAALDGAAGDVRQLVEEAMEDDAEYQMEAAAGALSSRSPHRPAHLDPTDLVVSDQAIYQDREGLGRPASRRRTPGPSPRSSRSPARSHQNRAASETSSHSLESAPRVHAEATVDQRIAGEAVFAMDDADDGFAVSSIVVDLNTLETHDDAATVQQQKRQQRKGLPHQSAGHTSPRERTSTSSTAAEAAVVRAGDPTGPTPEVAPPMIEQEDDDFVVVPHVKPDTTIDALGDMGNGHHHAAANHVVGDEEPFRTARQRKSAAPLGKSRQQREPRDARQRPSSAQSRRHRPAGGGPAAVDGASRQSRRKPLPWTEAAQEPSPVPSSVASARKGRHATRSRSVPASSRAESARRHGSRGGRRRGGTAVVPQAQSEPRRRPAAGRGRSMSRGNRRTRAVRSASAKKPHHAIATRSTLVRAEQTMRHIQGSPANSNVSPGSDTLPPPPPPTRRSPSPSSAPKPPAPPRGAPASAGSRGSGAKYHQQQRTRPSSASSASSARAQTRSKRSRRPMSAPGTRFSRPSRASTSERDRALSDPHNMDFSNASAHVLAGTGPQGQNISLDLTQWWERNRAQCENYLSDDTREYLQNMFSELSRFQQHRSSIFASAAR